MEISNRRTKVHNYSMWMKVISCILSFLMVLYAVPTSVFAEIASLASQVSAVGTDEITEKSTSAKIYEVVDRREETVKHFRSEDGSFTAVQYNMPVHEKDENGMWQDIDNTLSSDGSEYATSNARIKFAKKTTGNGNLFTLHDGNRKITMSLSGANKKVAGQVTNARTDFAEDATQLQKMTTLDKLSSKILYQEILTGVDLEYVVESCNIKENIIVKERADSYNYTFEIKLNNLEAMLCEDGSVIISEPNADEVFYTIPKGYMFDSAGNCSDAVTYSLTNGGNGKYSLVVSADADWINNSDRTFPVTVDPTIEYDNYDHNNVVESTYVTSGDGFADANYFSDNHLYVGYSANKGYYSTYVQMKSMPTLPNNATIVDAKLHMMVSGVNNGSAYIGIYRVTESWSANTLTYSSKPNHNSTPIDYRKVGGTVGFDWDITTLVNQWVDGTYSNYGVVLSMVATSDSSAVITLKSERMTKSVPSFVITYRDTKGIEPYYSYYSSGADLAGAGKVNAFTGNLAFIHSSVSTTDEILPYTISLAYNSCLSGKYYVGGQNVITPIASASTGKGFKLSFDETIEKIDWGDDNELYVWADADGTEHYFSVFDYAWIDESINGYCDEDGLGLYLADEAEDETGTGYLMTDDIGNKKHNINTTCFDGISVVKDTDCVTRYSYNDYGYVSKVDGSDGNSTFYTYDFNGLDVNKVYSSNGNSIDFDYDDNHRLISEINTNATNNFKIEYTYNDYGKVISTKITDNQEGRYSINSSVNLSTDTVNFGAVIEETDENDRTTKTFYDKKARITGTCGNDGYGVIYTYNRYGQITRVQEAVYDESTQTMKAFSGGSSVISTYNSKGNASAIRTPSATYTFGYDSFNNVTQISVNGRTLLSITYEDYNGNIAKNEYGNGDWVEYQYDNVNRVSEVWHSDYSDNAVFTYTYNANGNLSEYVDNINGRSYTYMYDQKGSLTQRVIKELNADSDADAVTCVEQYAYDDQGRMIDIYYNYLDTTEVPTLSYYQFTYDVAGNTTQIDYGGTLGHSHYSYDHFGRLDEESLTKGASDTFMFSKEYDYCGSGFTTSYQVDALWIEDSNDQYFDTLYDYDDAGNITSVEIYNDGLIQKFTYEYDGKDQLTRENIYVANHTSISKTITYSYDTSGNITSKKRYAYTEAEDLSDLSYTEIAYGYAVDTQEEIDDTYLNIHDEWNDLLTSFNGSAITYDEIGNPLTYGAYSYTWSNGRQLESVYQVFPYVNTTYQYNDEGVRTSKIVSGVKHEYTVSGGRINREVVYSSNGQYVTRDIRYYYDAAGNPISIRAFTRSSSTAAFTDTMYYLLTNMQGDVVAIYNADGERIFEYVYDAWGNILRSKQVATGGNAANSVNPFRYRGYYYDTETGLYYLQSRYYNPEWGRFLNADGYVSTGTGLLGYNMYAYCNNNPVNRIDPTGRFSWLILAAVLLFTPVGGTALQIATSTISYAGMAITSIWDKDVRADMNSIGWNPFNDNESDVQNSSKVSFYKGVPVFRTASGGRSGSFGAIFLTKGSGVDDLRHERGHNWQLMMMGIGTYGYTVGLPSPLRLGKWDRAGNYYGAPWETMADILGGVQGRTHSELEIANAWGYYAISTITFPFTALYWH